MITSEIVVAYTQCKLKGYLLLFAKEKHIHHEYFVILEEEAKRNRVQHLSKIKTQFPEAKPYFPEGIKKSIPVLLEANLIFDDIEAYADVILKIDNHYTPTLVIGTRKVSKEHKLQLAFIGYALYKLQKVKPATGTIIGSSDTKHTIHLDSIYNEIEQILRQLRSWNSSINQDEPALIINKHCPSCYFHIECEKKALEKDDLSLLSRINSKDVQKFHNKGIFTIAQLSYLFRPRKQRKGKKKSKIPLRYRPELQALSIRTKNIYIQELPEISRHKVELFLDIEGSPDQDFYYLIGLLISDGDKQLFHSFWADSQNDEQKIFERFVEEINKYPNTPIYHYGTYDSKAIHQLKERYGQISDIDEERLINVISFIHGKVYFPVKSNNLKELGRFLGAEWSHSKSSGLQSLVWRYYWNEGNCIEYKKLLQTYNEEDCNALYLLVKELILVSEAAHSMWNVDFADQPKKHATNISCQIHERLESLLIYAHADYDKNKISFKSKQDNDNSKNESDKKSRLVYRRITPPKIDKIITVEPKAGLCTRKPCKDNDRLLEKSELIAEKIIIDLHFTKNGVKRIVLKYTGNKAYCKKCGSYFSPPIISKLIGQDLGHNFQSWIIYKRVALRLPYQMITQEVQDIFNEHITTGAISRYIGYFSNYYESTESLLIQKILESPFVHVDETKINIQGTDQYVWVFTDGKHVIFRKTETREASIAHEFLSNYTGVLISDFYAGYDSVKCKQQKCLAHLIRDINDDLWKEPFNEEFELFVLAVKDLIVPIFEKIQQVGSKKKHIRKFKKTVDDFYKKNIDHKTYKFEVTLKYQKRFHRYRDSLFVFLEDNDIPWNNNMAERAIRHLAVQRKISGTFFDSRVSDYLLLLGIAQSCRFQHKPFLNFLLSQKKDVDLFKSPKLIKYSELVPKSKNQ